MDFGEVIEVIRVVNFAHDLRLDLEVKATSISPSLKKKLVGRRGPGHPLTRTTAVVLYCSHPYLINFN